MKLVDKQTSFNAGIVSPKLKARDRLKQYDSALADAMNVICTKYGAVTKRTGTHYVAASKVATGDSVFLPFAFSVTQNIIIELGDDYARFFTFDSSGVGAIPDPADPSNLYEIATGISEDILEELSFSQSKDVIYIAHSSFQTKALSRIANDNWTIEDFVVLDGPFGDINTEDTYTFAPSATTGTGITITAAGSGNTPFVSTDVGRKIRISNPSSGTSWGYCVITAYTDSTHVTVDVVNDFATTNASKYWKLGEWSDTTGFPACVTIHQQRLIFAGGAKDLGVWASKPNAFDDFAETDVGGAVTDDHAINMEISDEQAPSIKWVKSITSLLVGTTLGEFRIHSTGSVLTPTDKVAERQSSYGSYDINPVLMDNSVAFIQRLQRKIRDISYDYMSDSYRGPDLTLLAEHLTLGGVKKIVLLGEPNNIIVALKEDGTLLFLVYDSDQKVYAWSKVVIGGTDVVIKDICSLPSASYQQDVLFLIVDRTINGSTVRYIEMLTQDFLDSTDQESAVFLDSSLVYSGAETNVITGLDHLEGEEVTVINNGAVTVPKVVSGGKITLGATTTKAIVGLPYSCYLDTLEREIGDGRQFSIYLSKSRIVKLIFYLYRAIGVTVTQDDSSESFEILSRDASNNMDTVPPLMTERVNVPIQSTWSLEKTFHIESTAGLPFTLLGMYVEAELNAL